MILSNNQSSATLRVRDTCIIVGLLPFTIILITAALSIFENVRQSAEARKFCVCSDMSDIAQFEIVRVVVFLRSGVGAFS